MVERKFVGIWRIQGTCDSIFDLSFTLITLILFYQLFYDEKTNPFNYSVMFLI